MLENLVKYLIKSLSEKCCIETLFRQGFDADLEAENSASESAVWTHPKQKASSTAEKESTEAHQAQIQSWDWDRSVLLTVGKHNKWGRTAFCIIVLTKFHLKGQKGSTSNLLQQFLLSSHQLVPSHCWTGYRPWIVCSQTAGENKSTRRFRTWRFCCRILGWINTM